MAEENVQADVVQTDVVQNESAPIVVLEEKKPELQEENRERDEKGRMLPGHTANPNGRPKKEHSLTDTIRQMMTDRPEIKREISNKILELVMSGDVQTIRTLWSYIDGMPIQRSVTAEVDVNDILNDLESDYEHVGQEAAKQMVAAHPPVQNQE